MLHKLRGGKVKGKRILGEHPDTYAPGKLVTPRGVFIPTTPFDAMWYGVSQWMGITNDQMDYVLPNAKSFGCRLYSDSDLYVDGTGIVDGCGGDIVEIEQVFTVTEDRILTRSEQQDLCVALAECISEGSNGIEVNCVVLLQELSTDCSATDKKLTTVYELTSSVAGSIDLGAVNTCQSETTLPIIASAEEAIVFTPSPTSSPTLSSLPTLEFAPSDSPSTSLEPSQNPSSRPSFEPSFSSHPSSSLKPSTQVEGFPNYFGYDYVGEGQCLDDFPTGGRTYSYLSEASSLLSDCPSKCAPYRDLTEFRGFEFEYLTTTCRCLFDSDVDSSIITQEGSGGDGIIDTVDTTTNVGCFKKGFLEPPVIILGFEYIGLGQCLNAMDEQYNYVPISELTGDIITNCGAGCKALDPNLIGFWADPESDPVDCRCLYESGVSIPDLVTVPNSATGQITTSDYTSGQCYFKIPDPTMVPTNPPTTPPPVSLLYCICSILSYKIILINLNLLLQTKSPTVRPSAAPTGSPSKAVRLCLLYSSFEARILSFNSRDIHYFSISLLYSSSYSPPHLLANLHHRAQAKARPYHLRKLL